MSSCRPFRPSWHPSWPSSSCHSRPRRVRTPTHSPSSIHPTRQDSQRRTSRAPRSRPRPCSACAQTAERSRRSGAQRTWHQSRPCPRFHRCASPQQGAAVFPKWLMTQAHSREQASVAEGYQTRKLLDRGCSARRSKPCPSLKSLSTCSSSRPCPSRPPHPAAAEWPAFIPSGPMAIGSRHRLSHVFKWPPPDGRNGRPSYRLYIWPRPYEMTA